MTPYYYLLLISSFSSVFSVSGAVEISQNRDVKADESSEGHTSTLDPQQKHEAEIERSNLTSNKDNEKQENSSIDEEEEIADESENVEPKESQILLVDDDEEEDEDFDIDSFGIFMKDFYETKCVAKSTLMMTHFAKFVLNTMDFNHVREENSPVAYKQRLERLKFPSYDEIFTGMYTNYVLMSSMISLKACSIYYGDLNAVIANECNRYSRYLKSFLEAHKIEELFSRNPLKNDKNTEVVPKYVAAYVLEKLIETKGKLGEALNQDFTSVVQGLKETIAKNEIDMNEITLNKSSEVPVYKPQKSLDQAYTAIWKTLLDPVKENFLIFHNYFNDAMNINHFIESINDFIQLPESRPFLTSAWKELARSDRSLKNTNFANLVFRVLRLIETKRLESNIPVDENGDLNVTLPETLHTLVDVAVSRENEKAYSNFMVVV